MAQTTHRGMAHDGFTTKNFQELGKSLTSQNFQELLRPAGEAAVPVAPPAPAPVAQQPVQQPTAPAPKE
jgi:ribosomal protein L12E/L44/L45/RPP1/RPP2